MEFEIFDSVPRISEISIESFTQPVLGIEYKEDLPLDRLETSNQTSLNLFLYLYVVISFFFIFRFFKNSLQIYKYTQREFECFGNLKLIKCEDSEMASSFFNYLFINESQLFNKEDYLSVIKHESIHSKELHTLDVILTELLICVFWFNPFVWLYRKVILHNHEYIADDQSVSSGIDIEKYSNSLINMSDKKQCVHLTSGFNFILIKNRLIMLHKKKTSILNRSLKITAVLLLFTGVFVFSSCKEDFEDALVEESLVVVIDAGHGGKDPGNTSYDINEKDIVLNISDLLKALSNEKIKIITTRDDDNFFSLVERIAFINKHKPDLLVSLHCNAHSNAEQSGIEAYYYESDDTYSRSASIEYSSVLASGLIKENFGTAKIKPSNFKILKEVNSPAVLLEIGFLTNPSENSKLKKVEEQLEITKTIYDGLKEIRTLNSKK